MEILWIWHGMKYWLNPTFSNYLKARWHHYKFCKGRANVFILHRYLDRWEEDLKDRADRPGDNVHSYGYYALWEMIKERPPSENLMEFLESEDLTKGIDQLILELNNLQIERTPENEGTTSALEENNSLGVLPAVTEIQAQKPAEVVTTDDPQAVSIETILPIESILEEPGAPLSPAKLLSIDTRTYVIAADILHELYRTPVEYEELKRSRSNYVDFLKQQFRVERLASSVYKLRNFNYKAILKDKAGNRKGQLYPQLQQIIENPSIFGEKVSQHAADLLKKYFENHISK
jgi:hypothetical protein